MYSKLDHFSDASQGSSENQIDLNTVLGHKLLESVERFLSFQGHALRSFLQDLDEFTRRLLAVKSATELASLAIDEVQVASRKAMAYICHTAGIAVGTQSELVDISGAQVGEANVELSEMIAGLSGSAPGSSNRVINLLRMLCGQASASYEQLTQWVKQALDLVETSLISAGRQFANAANRTMQLQRVHI